MRHNTEYREISLRAHFPIHSSLGRTKTPDCPIVSGRVGSGQIYICLVSPFVTPFSVRFDLDQPSGTSTLASNPHHTHCHAYNLTAEISQGKMLRLGVKHLEVKIVCGLGKGRVPVPIRLVASNPTGYAVRVETYFEASVF